MKVHIVGGGPAGLYFAILLRRAQPDSEVVVFERNQPDDPYGFGVVFSDATGHNLADAEPATFRAMNEQFARWDDIDIHFRGELLRSTGHGFSGLSRRALIGILTDRARELGVELRYGVEVRADAAADGTGSPADRSLPIDQLLDADLVLAADGANSVLREQWADAFQPTIDWRPNRFVWLGTTRPFPAFTFYFRNDEHGLWRVHAYQYEGGQSTFIVETTEETWRAAGLDDADEDRTIAFCENLFAEELEGHPLLRNRSVWRQFATVRNEQWSHTVERADGRPTHVALIGDAAHTAHFSIGSGTKLAMEDAIALADALAGQPDIASALHAYEEERRPVVASTQRAAQVSLQWFEETERYMDHAPLQFAFTLLTRSLRVTHENLRLRDAGFVADVDRWFAQEAAHQSGRDVPLESPPPPLFTPLRVRDLVLENRVVVSPMCQYSAEEGVPNDWHLVHIGSRAIGGAGLIMAEMTNVSPEARISPGCTGLYDDAQADGWRRITDFVHEHSRAAIGVQLGHAGRKGSTRRMWEGDVEPLPDGNWDIVAASPIPWKPHSQVPREMSRADMDQVLDDYVRAAALAERAGFDWLELHVAHGYLLASFVSPLTNHRDDEYGGTLENRLRYPLEAFDAVRAAWPERKPMSVRISAVDWKPGGIDSVEAVEIARAFRDHGCDVIDVSAGQTVPDQKPVYGRLFQTPFSDRIRHEADMPTMAVGNISSFTDVNTILAAGRADLCMLARMHLWDPYWTRHAAYELGHALPWPPQYSSLDRFTPRFRSEGDA